MCRVFIRQRLTHSKIAFSICAHACINAERQRSVATHGHSVYLRSEGRPSLSDNLWVVAWNALLGSQFSSILRRWRSNFAILGQFSRNFPYFAVAEASSRPLSAFCRVSGHFLPIFRLAAAFHRNFLYYLMIPTSAFRRDPRS